MENSLTGAELSDSIVKIDKVDSRPGSDKSDNFEELDIDSSTDSNGKNETEIEIEHAAAGAVPLTIEEFDKNLPETVLLLRHPETGTKVYVVGTAHFSQESKDDVAKVIQTVQPNVVILELCDARIGIIALDEETLLKEAANVSFESIMNTIKKNGMYFGLTYLLLLNLYAHFTKEIGMAPGGEFRVAFREARAIPGCVVKLGDRPIKTTILRALAKLSWWQTCKLACHLIFDKEPISKEDVEKCKRRDMLEQMLAEMSGEYPTIAKVFVDERDIILTYSIQQACKTVNRGEEPLKVVSVVGLGHALGIARLFPVDQSPNVSQILVVPPQTLSSKIIRATFKISLLSFGGFLLYKYLPLPQVVRSTAHSAFAKIVDNIKPR